MKEIKTLIAIPCLDAVPTPFLRSALRLRRVGEPGIYLTSSSLVYDARNILADKAVKEGYDRVLWLDSDMVFEPDLMERLSADMDEGREFVSGLYFSRKPPVIPVVYAAVGQDKETHEAAAIPRFDYPEDTIFDVAAAGFGACMMTTDLLRRVKDEFGLPFSPILGFGEDLSFCMRATQLGAKLYCDSRVKLGHVASTIVTEETWRLSKKQMGA